MHVREINGQSVVSRLSARLNAAVGDRKYQTRHTLELTDWRDSAAEVMPQEIRQIVEQLDPANLASVLIKSVITRKFDLTQMEKPINEDECWVSFYGIPEPEGARRSSRMPWIIGLAVCLAIAIAAKVLKTR